jgi:hypothetical protein
LCSWQLEVGDCPCDLKVVLGDRSDPAILRALRPAPADRHANVGEFAAALGDRRSRRF